MDGICTYRGFAVLRNNGAWQHEARTVLSNRNQLDTRLSTGPPDISAPVVSQVGVYEREVLLLLYELFERSLEPPRAN